MLESRCHHIILMILKGRLRMHVSQLNILKFLKTRFGMTFRRISTRPVYKNPWFIRLMQLIFCIEYLNIVTSDLIVVNIYETLFSINTEFNYSWAPKHNKTITETSASTDQCPLLEQ